METGSQFKFSSDGLEKPGIKPATLVYKVSELTTMLQNNILEFISHTIYCLHYMQTKQKEISALLMLLYSK